MMGSVRPSGLHLNKLGILVVLLVIVVFMLLYKLLWSTSSGDTLSEFNFGALGTRGDLGASQIGLKFFADGKTIDVSNLSPAPALAADAEQRLLIDAKLVDIQLGAAKVPVYTKTISPPSGQPKLDVILLHGAAFTSGNWVTLKTLHNLASWGYRAVALDMPGRGQSPTAINKEQLKQFLGPFIVAMGLSNVVIVAPSASGVAALPYLFTDPAHSTKRVKGFVPITPVQTYQYKDQYPQSQIQTLIIYGINDSSGLITSRNLQLLPQSKVAPIANAGHACYLDNPKVFHTVMYHWLSTLS